MQNILSENIDKITDLCSKHNVLKLYAFGSICTPNFNDLSDIDLLISFKTMDFGDYADTYFEIAERFEELFHRPVDLITEQSLSNPYFIRELNKTRKLIYG